MRSIILFLCLVFTQVTYAQRYNAYNYCSESNRFHVSVSPGITYLYGDIDKSKNVGAAMAVKLDYSIFKGIYLGVEGQFGSIKANNSQADPRWLSHNYQAAGVFVTMHPFEVFFDDTRNKSHAVRNSFTNRLKNSVYVGLGILGIQTQHGSIYRDPNNPGTFGPLEWARNENGETVSVYANETRSFTLPSLTAGIALPIAKSFTPMSDNYFSLLLNGQFNFVNSDDFDGYTPYDSSMERIFTRNDMYSMYSVGVRYSF